MTYVKCGEECVFCLSDIEENNKCTLGCKHVFHTECFLNYLNYTHHGIRCPTCRTSIKLEHIDKIYDNYYKKVLYCIDTTNKEIANRSLQLLYMNIKRVFTCKTNKMYKFLILEMDILRQEKKIYNEEIKQLNLCFLNYLKLHKLI